MGTDLGDLQLTASCPECAFEIFLLVSEVAAQTYVRCPCCRILIRVEDADASTYTAARDMDRALREAADLLAKSFGKGLR